jgi:hypothetical protein
VGSATSGVRPIISVAGIVGFPVPVTERELDVTTGSAKQDELWGRVPGCRPPIGPWAPLLFAAVSAVLLTLVVLLLVRLPGPEDERTLADQRNGLLDSGPVLPRSVLGVSFGGRPVVLLFVRAQPGHADLSRWAADLPDAADVRVVVQTSGAGAPDVVVHDPDRVLAAAVRLPRSRDGGPGVGYAVIDATRTVRYSTLDPSWPGNGFEVATIAGAVS